MGDDMIKRALLALVLCVTFVGCDKAAPGPLPVAVADGWAWAMVGAASLEAAEPRPKPVPGSPCSTCNGTGKVGDGRVAVECQDCGGDGSVGLAQRSGLLVSAIVSSGASEPGQACATSGSCQAPKVRARIKGKLLKRLRAR